MVSRRKVYRTKSGVLVTIHGRVREPYRGGQRRWKGDAYRVDTGGRHGWLWMHTLTEVKS